MEGSIDRNSSELTNSDWKVTIRYCDFHRHRSMMKPALIIPHEKVREDVEVVMGEDPVLY